MCWTRRSKFRGRHKKGGTGRTRSSVTLSVDDSMVPPWSVRGGGLVYTTVNRRNNPSSAAAISRTAMPSPIRSCMPRSVQCFPLLHLLSTALGHTDKKKKGAAGRSSDAETYVENFSRSRRWKSVCREARGPYSASHRVGALRRGEFPSA